MRHHSGHGPAIAGPRPLPFVGLDELDGRPHVVVDGAARRGTVLTLSHWPAAPTPPVLWRDLSVEIALAYLDTPELWCDAEAVTIDHLDADGLVSLFALTDPPEARRRARLLAAVARAGDFEVADSLDAARVAFTLDALTDPTRSPFARGAASAGREGNGWAAHCARRVLELLVELCDSPERFHDLYDEEESAYLSSLAAVAAGLASIEELAEVHLAVVRVEHAVAGAPGEVGTPGAVARAGDGGGRIGLHPAAIHAHTAMPRVLVLEPARTTYYDRYETWVRFVSAELPRRVDLQPLAAELSAVDRAALCWRADPAAQIRPLLACEGRSAIPEAELLARLTDHLATSPPAWDPFAGVPARPAPASAAAASRSGTSGRARARSAGRRSARP